MWWAIDRIESGIAVLVGDNGGTIQLRATRAMREGQIYQLRANGRLYRNTAEERRRAREAKRIQEWMRASDPGGDIKL